MRAAEGRWGEAALFAFISGFVLSAAAAGVEFAGGTGEPNDPYQIGTVEQLLSIGTDVELLDRHYVLIDSIDLSGLLFEGPVIRLFRGRFDGNGYTIRNLRMEGEWSGGLFGTADGEIRDLGLVNAQIIGGFGCGGLVGRNSGVVINCYSTGAVLGVAGSNAGGLVGLNSGTISDSYSTATVLGSNSVGGLAGMNMGRVSCCYSTGDITGDTQVGGLVGSNGGQIEKSHSLASVAGQSMAVGGLAGWNADRITACYSAATVVGLGQGWRDLGLDVSTGGLVGENNGNISSCYATGRVAGAGFVGGLAGHDTGQIASSYAAAAVTSQGRSVGGLVGGARPGRPVPDPVSSYFLDPADGGGPDNEIGVSLTDEQMRRQASFAGFDFWPTVEDGQDDPWFMPPNAYPVLAWQVEVSGLERVPDVSGLSLDVAVAALEAAGFVAGQLSYDFHQTMAAGYVIHSDPHGLAAPGATVDLVLSSGQAYDWADNPGDGTAEDPYQIQTAGQLESLGDHPALWDRHFVLSADVDMAGRTYYQALIAPDVDASRSGFQGTSFRGTFDGAGHTIRNLTIRHGDVRHDYVGLFGMVAETGRIEALHLVDAEVQGGSRSYRYVGVLAGYNAGTISRCSATGVLRGNYGDGLVGVNTGTLTGCRAEVARI